MKRNLPAYLIVAVVFALCLAFAGCGDSSGGQASSSAADTSSAASSSSAGESAEPAASEDGGFVGTWKLSSMDDLDEEGLASMIDSGYSMFFVLQEDGAVSYEFLGFADYGTYQAESDTQASLTLEDDDNWKDKLYLEEGMLKAESVDGGFAYFTRITEAEHQEYNAKYNYNPELPSLDKADKADTAGKADSPDASSDQAKSAEVNTTIADDDLCTIKVLDTFGDDDVAGYNVEVTNKSDRTLTFMTGGRSGSSTVDGKEVPVAIYVEVEAGQTVKTDFDYWTSDLGGGVEKLVNVKGQINVNDMSIPDTIATYQFEL